MSSVLHGLPDEIKKKINKTKQTRGAQPYDRVPFQNRVNRTGIALVPYRFRDKLHPDGFSDGYRVMVRPSEYFERAGVPRKDFDPKVKLGENAFVYYDNRRDWKELPPPKTWAVCEAQPRAGDRLVAAGRTGGRFDVIAPRTPRVIRNARNSCVE
ncbi:MAG: BstXI family restriction endonuclease [Alphaproteobacteria bacterium]|nr:BstXI family restriction endonuclease [Alphaproteobacteria bacterium]